MSLHYFQVWEGLNAVKTCRDILGETDPVSTTNSFESERSEGTWWFVSPMSETYIVDIVVQKISTPF